MIILPKSSNPLTNYIMAAIYILYGVIKIGLGIVIIFFEKEDIKDKPFLNKLETIIDDTTLAGRMYNYVLMAFGVFTIVHGMILLDLLPLWFEEIFVSKLVQYGVLVLFGVIMIVFYALILYTDLPISKKKEKYSHYTSIGLIGGILFIITPPIMELIEYIFPYFHKLSIEQQNMCIIAIIIIITVIVELIYLYFKNSSESDNTKKIIKHQIKESTMGIDNNLIK